MRPSNKNVNCKILIINLEIADLQEQNKTKESKALEEGSNRVHITSINKRGGGGGHGGGGGGHASSGDGHSGGSAHGDGSGHGGEEMGTRDGSILGVAGGAAAATAARGREGRNGHQRGSTSPNAHLGLTLPLVLVVLGFYFIQFLANN